MPCYQPKPAWQAKLGGKLSFTYVRHWRTIMVPCTTCIGCLKAHAQAWAFRCHLEGTCKPHNAFATLTYDDEHLPFTLNWNHGQQFLKAFRQRATTPIRYFASGEYGSKTKRPHYHFLLFGHNAVGAANQAMVQRSWPHGAIQLTPVTPARIAYCAGYTDKKADDRFRSVEHCDPETGEVWQPPFIKMSLKPGIGGHARQWRESWRLFAIKDGHKLSVPRYLHQAWRDTATLEELLQLQAERDTYLLNRDKDLNARLQAAERIAHAKQRETEQQRQQQSQKREFDNAQIRRFLTINPTGDTAT